MTDAARQPGQASSHGLTPPSLSAAGGRFLSDLVVELGFVDAETVEAAVEAARRPGLTLEKVLVQQGALTEDQLARALAERYGLDHIDLDAYPIDRSAAGLLQEAPARRYRAVPVGFSDDGSLVVAVADPSDSLGLSDIAVMTKLALRPAVAARSAVDELLDTLDFMEETTRPAAQALGSLILPPEEEGQPAAVTAPPKVTAPATGTPPPTGTAPPASAPPAPAPPVRQVATPVPPPAAGDEVRMRELAELREILEAERARHDERVTDLRSTLETERAARDALVSRLREESTELRERLAEAEATHTDEVTRLAALLRAERTKGLDGSPGPAESPERDPAAPDLAAPPSEAVSTSAAAAERIAALEQELERLRGEAEGVADQRAELQRLRRQAQAAEGQRAELERLRGELAGARAAAATAEKLRGELDQAYAASADAEDLRAEVAELRARLESSEAAVRS